MKIKMAGYRGYTQSCIEMKATGDWTAMTLCATEKNCKAKDGQRSVAHASRGTYPAYF